MCVDTNVIVERPFNWLLPSQYLVDLSFLIVDWNIMYENLFMISSLEVNLSQFCKRKLVNEMMNKKRNSPKLIRRSRFKMLINCEREKAKKRVFWLVLITFKTSNADAHDNAVIFSPSKTSIMIHKAIKHRTQVNYGSFSCVRKYFSFLSLDFVGLELSKKSSFTRQSVFGNIFYPLVLSPSFTRTVSQSCHKNVMNIEWGDHKIQKALNIQNELKNNWHRREKKTPSDIEFYLNFYCLGF
jgi:hypothetical protein